MIDEEEILVLSFLAYQHTGTMLHTPAISVLIPTCSDRDPFHRDYFSRRQGALSAAVPALQAKRNAAFGQKNPAFGGIKPAIGSVAALARCPASRRAPRLPE
ncbi:MAG: hypothetical protein OEQ18_06495 [Gammaproteobacteria bacterium]|nr:hypothetical protein [Gammaproteobacteria bacterium]